MKESHALDCVDAWLRVCSCDKEMDMMYTQ